MSADLIIRAYEGLVIGVALSTGTVFVVWRALNIMWPARTHEAPDAD